MSFTWIAPTIVETQTTGFHGAAERELNGKSWRVEFHSASPQVRMMKDGKPVTWDGSTDAAQRFAYKAADFLRSIHALKGAA